MQFHAHSVKSRSLKSVENCIIYQVKISPFILGQNKTVSNDPLTIIGKFWDEYSPTVVQILSCWRVILLSIKLKFSPSALIYLHGNLTIFRGYQSCKSKKGFFLKIREIEDFFFRFHIIHGPVWFARNLSHGLKWFIQKYFHY